MTPYWPVLWCRCGKCSRHLFPLVSETTATPSNIVGLRRISYMFVIALKVGNLGPNETKTHRCLHMFSLLPCVYTYEWLCCPRLHSFFHSFLFFLSFCSQRYDTLLKDMEKKSEKHREVLASLQQEFQKAQGVARWKFRSSDLFTCTHPYTQWKLMIWCKPATQGWVNSACIFSLIYSVNKVTFALLLINMFFMNAQLLFFFFEGKNICFKYWRCHWSRCCPVSDPLPYLSVKKKHRNEALFT